jgi:vacuolar-type H+-ATPase subunit H
MGPWLKQSLGYIEQTIQGDMYPMSIGEGERIACQRISDAEMNACKILRGASDKSSRVVADANLQATDMILAAREQADHIRDHAQKELVKALNDASYAAGVLVKAINEI